VPYALSNLVNGQVPSARAVAEGYVAGPGEIVLTDAQFMERNTWIWDATTQTLRARSASEVLAHAKTMKEAELRDAANSWYVQNVRSFEGAVVVFKAATGATLTAEEVAIRDAMTNNYNTLRTKIGTVRAATALNQVESVVW
jgi:hypothetical protein